VTLEQIQFLLGLLPRITFSLAPCWARLVLRARAENVFSNVWASCKSLVVVGTCWVGVHVAARKVGDAILQKLTTLGMDLVNLISNQHYELAMLEKMVRTKLGS
jgi:hypothetical protein